MNISFADIGIWCNGNTTDSGPVIPGSSPGIPTIKKFYFKFGIWCNGNTTDSGPVIPGSSPGIPTIKKFYFKFGIWCNGNTTDSGPVIPGSSPGIPTHTVRHLSVMKGVFFVYRNSVLWSIHNNKPQSFRPGVYCIYFFSASIALIFCFTISRSVLSFSILRFISSTRLLPFLLAVLKKPRLFS